MRRVHADQYAHPTFELSMNTDDRRAHVLVQRLRGVYAACRS
jgi:hypothetical protein